MKSFLKIAAAAVALAAAFTGTAHSDPLTMEEKIARVVGIQKPADRIALASYAVRECGLSIITLVKLERELLPTVRKEYRLTNSQAREELAELSKGYEALFVKHQVSFQVCEALAKSRGWAYDD